jgi:hypothetical protein
MKKNMGTELLLKPSELGIIICMALFVGAHIVYWPLWYKNLKEEKRLEKLEKLEKEYDDE